MIWSQSNPSSKSRARNHILRTHDETHVKGILYMVYPSWGGIAWLPLFTRRGPSEGVWETLVAWLADRHDYAEVGAIYIYIFVGGRRGFYISTGNLMRVLRVPHVRHCVCVMRGQDVRWRRNWWSMFKWGVGGGAQAIDTIFWGGRVNRVN